MNRNGWRALARTKQKKTVRIRGRRASCCFTVLFETTLIETNKTFVSPSLSFIGDAWFVGRVDARIRFVFNQCTSLRLRDSLLCVWGGGGCCCPSTNISTTKSFVRMSDKIRLYRFICWSSRVEAFDRPMFTRVVFSHSTRQRFGLVRDSNVTQV